MLDRALVTGRSEESEAPSLFEIEAIGPGLRPDPGSWPAVGMAATTSMTLTLENVPVIREVGEPGYYTSRVGFWLGSLNVAACWYGGALGLAREFQSGDTAEALGLIARLDGALLEMGFVLRSAADEIDAHPVTDVRKAELLALRVRDCVYRNCQVVITTAAELGGTFASTRNAAQARRLADLPVYLRQFHPARDRARLGELLQLFRPESSRE